MPTTSRFIKDPISDVVGTFTQYVVLRPLKIGGKSYYRGEVCQPGDTWTRLKQLVEQRLIAPLPTVAKTVEHNGRQYIDEQFIPRVDNGDDTNAFRVERHSTAQVIEFVVTHPELLDDVIAAEEAGKQRKSLLDGLRMMKEEPNGDGHV